MKSKAEQLADERYPILWDEDKLTFHNRARKEKRAAFIAGYEAGKQAKIKDIEQADTTVFDSIVQEADKWIIRDNPPKEDLQNVIALLKNGTVTEMTYSSITNSWFKSGIARESKKNKVTHWQPLPQPPKTK